MFKNLAFLANNAFLRVSADTKLGRLALRGLFTGSLPTACRDAGSAKYLPFLWQFVLYQTYLVCSIKIELFY